MNTFQFSYDSQKYAIQLKYAIELLTLLMPVFYCQIVFGQNFAPILKINLQYCILC